MVGRAGLDYSQREEQGLRARRGGGGSEGLNLRPLVNIWQDFLYI